MFGSKPDTNKITSSLVKEDHPEIEDSLDNRSKYHSLIEELQQAISLGRFNIANATMKMSAFRL